MRDGSGRRSPGSGLGGAGGRSSGSTPLQITTRRGSSDPRPNASIVSSANVMYDASATTLRSSAWLARVSGEYDLVLGSSGLNSQESRKSATHGMPVRLWTISAARCAVVGEEVL